ncbi:hypothetical protein ACW0JT_20425 [Arthrobacter sp. SA17]
MDSHIDGDDETPWPEKRRRYRLWGEDMNRVPAMGLRYRAWEQEGQVEGDLSEDEQRVEEIMAAMDPVVDGLLAAHFAEQEAQEEPEAKDRDLGL